MVEIVSLAQPKPIKHKKPKGRTASEKRHCDAIHALPCIVTGYQPVIWHHCFTGGGGRSDDFKTIPLFPALHTENIRRSMIAGGLMSILCAIHENKKLFEDTYGTENELLCKTYEKLDAIGKLEPGARKIWEKIR